MQLGRGPYPPKTCLKNAVRKEKREEVGREIERLDARLGQLLLSIPEDMDRFTDELLKKSRDVPIVRFRGLS